MKNILTAFLGLMIATAAIVIPITCAWLVSPLFLLTLILTCPLAVIFFGVAMSFFQDEE